MMVHSVGADFVSTHATAHLVAAFFRDHLVFQFIIVFGHTLSQINPRISSVGVLASLGCLDHDACGAVG